MHTYFAYLDAGSGSLILQMVVGGIAGIAALVRFKWHTFRSKGENGVSLEESHDRGGDL